jgi:hypothetical protein
MNWPMFPGGGGSFPSEIVGVISATAEIPLNIAMMQPPSGTQPTGNNDPTNRPSYTDIDEPD